MWTKTLTLNNTSSQRQVCFEKSISRTVYLVTHELQKSNHIFWNHIWNCVIVSMLPSNLIQNEDNLEDLDKFSRHILENHKKDCESWQQSETDRSFCKAKYDMMLKKLQEF